MKTIRKGKESIEVTDEEYEAMQNDPKLVAKKFSPDAKIGKE